MNGRKDKGARLWDYGSSDGDDDTTTAGAEEAPGYTRVGCYKSVFDIRSLEEDVFEAADMSVEVS